ncbi:unnamed protein product [Darwinula stevensoni]|uniref:O-methyltransferase n=1 Tax=Darwinula stevensoni TaxID=69355 RepID=A0A7R9AA15_9CRUS|nr:unnamed protein product [Darwinula stevensoni]CAG0897975.1 unnamed protein product [Darwinula stevensoni]
MQTETKQRRYPPHTFMDVMEDNLQKALELLENVEIPEEARDLIRKTHVIARDVYPYSEKYSTQPSPILKGIWERTMGEDWKGLHAEGKISYIPSPIMMTDSTEGKRFSRFVSYTITSLGGLLQMLVKVTGAKNCLEVGMFTGFSTLSMAEALPEDGRVVSLELEPFFEEYNRRNAFDKSPHGHKIHVRIGNARDILEELAEEKMQFDLAFLDADKKSYQKYFEVILPIRDGVALVCRRDQ